MSRSVLYPPSKPKRRRLRSRCRAQSAKSPLSYPIFAIQPVAVLHTGSSEPTILSLGHIQGILKMRILRVLRRAQYGCQLQLRRIDYQSSHQFHNTPSLPTDGVYDALTEMRVRTPWIEALKKQKQEGVDSTKKFNVSATPADRDLTPKKMSDSFHRVVWQAWNRTKSAFD